MHIHIVAYVPIFILRTRPVTWLMPAYNASEHAAIHFDAQNEEPSAFLAAIKPARKSSTVFTICKN